MAGWPQKTFVLLLGAAVAGLPPTAVADIFMLTTGGEVRGELLNPDQSPRALYLIRPYAGGKIALTASLVTEVVAQRPIEIAYDQMKLDFGDTVAGQWQLAEWCGDNNLPDERTRHLKRVIQLDPDHAEARRLLGFDRVGERWLTRDEVMQEKGYVKYEGRWRLSQEVEILERERAAKIAKKKYYEEVRRYRSWLERGDKSARAEEYLLAIKSPLAVDVLIKNLEDVKKYEHKVVFARALANIPTVDSIKTLVEYSYSFDAFSDAEENEDFRYHCFDLLEKTKPPAAVTMYINVLKHKDNRYVNRGAIGLARLGARTAVQPLIDALVTEHVYKIGNGSPGQTTTTFGSGGGGSGTGFGTGGGPRVIKRWIRNEEVLRALKELTGKDFYFDKNSWYAWYKSQKPAAPIINTRRD